MIAPGGHIRIQFQSTPPRREVTGHSADCGADRHISIHTSPKGGDCISYMPVFTLNFNPHLPEGR